ncbi:antihemorrhagic factor cHLP-B-like isoform X1 [Chiloscyllium punctatum]|uniref:antihemorrhagic factor cHLP-B-like isoform X1 n=1 Tax=Chiloscyllium punctatum TaxID=137246 RepID=UPI003B640FDE
MNWLVMLVTCIQFHNLPVVAYRQVVTFSAIPCDAVGAVKAADLAVHFINNVRRKGFKYKLNRLKNAQEKQEQYEISYYLEFDVFETQCPVSSSKPLKRCGIRPLHSMKSFGECKIIIRISKGLQNVKDFQCSEHPVQKPCRRCWYTMSLNNRMVDRSVQVAIQKYNSESNDTNYFSLFNITKVLTKSVPSQRILVEFIIQETNCFKDDFAVVLTACIPKPLKYAHLGFCTASFDLESPDDGVVEVNCDIYATKGVTVRGLSGQVAPHEDTYPDGEQIFKSKLKRSTSNSKRRKTKRPRKKDSSSSESSESAESAEERQMRRHRGPFRRPTIRYHIFPHLPPHPYTCPGQPRYVLRTH